MGTMGVVIETKGGARVGGVVVREGGATGGQDEVLGYAGVGWEWVRASES